METLKFKQKAKIGVPGSLINQMMSNNSSLPKVGEGATQLHYSDRTCYEVVEVSLDYKQVKLEHLEAEAKVKNSPMGHQDWVLKPTGVFSTLVWRNGKWKIQVEKIHFTKDFISSLNNPDGSIPAQLTDELRDEIYQGDVLPQKVVEGVTELKKEYHPINILFGVKDYYYDWSF